MAKIKLVCKNCNKEFEKYESYVNALVKKGSYPNFCCRKCQSEYQKKQVKYKTFICLQCNEEFERTEREVKNSIKKGNEIKFCSKKCKSDYWGKDRIKVVCYVCNKEFLKQKKDIHDKNFCSKSCYNKHKESLNTYKICKSCGKKFEVKKSYLISQNERKQEVNFCSKECKLDFQRKDMVMIKCDICGISFIKNKKKIKDINLCSKKCKELYLNKYHRNNRTCKYCGKEFTTSKYRFDHGQKFCNIICFNKYRTKLKEAYKEIAHFLRSCREYKIWRNNVFERANFKCEQCGSSSNIQAHHKKTLYSIVENYNFNTKEIISSKIFNDTTNGICLCQKCHSEIHPQLLRAKNGQFCRLKIKPQKS